MNIDIELFYKLQREAINDAKERSSYYEGFIQGMYKADAMISRSRTDKENNCCEEEES